MNLREDHKSLMRKLSKWTNKASRSDDRLGARRKDVAWGEKGGAQTDEDINIGTGINVNSEVLFS